MAEFRVFSQVASRRYQLNKKWQRKLNLTTSFDKLCKNRFHIVPLPVPIPFSQAAEARMEAEMNAARAQANGSAFLRQFFC